MMFVQNRILGFFVGAAFALASATLVSAQATQPALTINAGDIFLSPNLAGQVREFTVTGTGAQVGGIEFDIQIGDGGAALGGTDTGPTITSIDLKNGTIFGTSSNQTDVVTFPLARQSTDDLGGNGATVAATDGSLIASVTFDTTGISFAPAKSLLLSGVAGSFNTHFVDGNLQPINTVANNGTITVTPEPTAISLLILGGGMLLGRRRRAEI